MILSNKRTTKALNSLHEWTGWSAPTSLANPEDRFSRIRAFCLFVSNLNVQVNTFSVKSGRVFLDSTSTKQQIKCLAQGHNTVTPLVVGLELPSLTLYQLSHYAPLAGGLAKHVNIPLVTTCSVCSQCPNHNCN